MRGRKKGGQEHLVRSQAQTLRGELDARPAVCSSGVARQGLVEKVRQ